MVSEENFPGMLAHYRKRSVNSNWKFFLSWKTSPLIPKYEAFENHFNLSSLINTTYKAISIILLNMLHPILQREIIPLQNALT